MSLCFLASGLSLKGTSAGLTAADAVVKPPWHSLSLSPPKHSEYFKHSTLRQINTGLKITNAAGA